MRYQLSRIRYRASWIMNLVSWLGTLLLLSCVKEPPVFKKSKFLMDTAVTITAVGHKQEAEKAIDETFSEIERLEALMSGFREGSDVDRINKSAGIKPVKVDRDVLKVIIKAREISEMTGGAFDITIGPLSSLWGFGTKENYLPQEKEIKRLLYLVDYRRLIVDDSKSEVFLKRKGMSVDLGGIAKGYAADRGIEVLRRKGIKAGIVAVAGDIRVFGKRPDGKPWHIGIKHPREKDKTIAAIDLEDSSISTAGDYERFFIKDGIRYNHILNPKTGYPSTGCQSVTIISKEGILVDALATGVFVLGPEKGMGLIEEREGIEGIIVDSKGVVTVSSGLEGRVEL
jgi:thiamine biosynthesis lipoprotein